SGDSAARCASGSSSSPRRASLRRARGQPALAAAGGLAKRTIPPCHPPWRGPVLARCRSRPCPPNTSRPAAPGGCAADSNEPPRRGGRGRGVANLERRCGIAGVAGPREWSAAATHPSKLISRGRGAPFERPSVGAPERWSRLRMPSANGASILGQDGERFATLLTRPTGAGNSEVLRDGFGGVGVGDGDGVERGAFAGVLFDERVLDVALLAGRRDV